MPESFKVLIKELQSLGLDVKVLDKNNEEIDLKQDFDDDDDIGFTPSDDLFQEQNVADNMDGYSVDEGVDDDYTTDDDDDSMFSENSLNEEDPFDLGDGNDEF